MGVQPSVFTVNSPVSAVRFTIRRELISAIVVSEMTRLLNGINEDGGGAAGRANRGYEAA